MLTKPKIQPCSVFQSTLPRGSDAVHTSGNVALCYFNPRSGAGHCGIRCTHFNPRSLAGATVSTRFLRPITLFQSTLPLTGATQARIIYRLVAANFNPRSLAGATNADGGAGGKFNDFNPRSLAGSTTPVKSLLLSTAFQSTLPRGSDSLPLAPQVSY